MCNIAGYAGTQNAAPILLEMLRRQQPYDGGMSTGIATIYQGRLYWRKVVGDVDTLLKTTDALYLPGTVGIAHTRPGGTPETYSFAHPSISVKEDMALVANGTGRGMSDKAFLQEIASGLEADGYSYRGTVYGGDKEGGIRTKDGARVNTVEMRMLLAQRHYENGKTLTDAMARSAAELYKDAAMAAVHVNEPDRVIAVRTSRPLLTCRDESGTYLATAQFAFPDELMDKAEYLPLQQACAITKDGVQFCEKMTGCEEVSEVTEYTMEEGYRRICAMLEGREAEPLYFDDLEIAIYKEMKDLFPGGHTLVQDARLAYDILYRLDKEGKLNRIIRTLPNGKRRMYFWI